MKVKIDKFTHDQAQDYADREGMIKGFSKDSAKWKNAYNQALSESLETMSLGRNPYYRNPRDEATWPEVFGNDGFCAKVAFRYKGKEGDQVTKREISERVKASVTALVYLYLNGILNIKTTTATSETGFITHGKMSDLQMRGSEENFSVDAADEENIAVVMNQIILTVVETACYEFLLPFFTMNPNDVQKIVSKIDIKGKANSRAIAKVRTEVEKKLRERIGDKLKKISFADLILGE